MSVIREQVTILGASNYTKDTKARRPANKAERHFPAQTGLNEAFAGLYHVLIFGLAAVGLLFACMGHAYAGHHHVWIIAAEAAVQSYAHTQNAFVCLICGVICGTLAGIIGDIEGNTINCGTDSHIVNPACASFIMTFVVNACFPAA